MRMLALVGLTVAAASASAQPAVDFYVRQQLEARRIVGASVAVVKDGKVQHTGAYGMADLENGVRVTSKTVFEIGSVTKQFTATLVLMLAEEGKLKLDDPIHSHMPDLPKAWEGVTVRHLLTHTSGIKSYTSIPGFGGVARSPGTPENLLKIVAPEPMEFKPGEKWSYNNTGYYLLGMLIEKLTSRSYRAVLQDKILRPLGMMATDLYAFDEIVPGRARGYATTPRGLKNAEFIDMGWPFSAGALMSTAEDMGRWALALDEGKLLSKSSWDEMYKPFKLNDGRNHPYGFGWGLSNLNGIGLIEHGGAIPGFESAIVRVPEKKLTVVVLTNTLPGRVVDLARGIAGVLDESLKPETPKAIEDKDPKTTQFLEGVLKDAIAGKLKPEVFDEQMRKIIFPTNANAIKDLADQLGPLKVFALAEAKDDGKNKLRVYNIVLGDSPMTAIFNIDATGKISGFAVRPK